VADGQTIILNSDYRRMQAHRLIEQVPQGAVLNIRPARRTNDQNALMWAILSEISRAKPDGRCLSPEVWKCLFMDAAGFKCTFEPTLDGTGVIPLGFKSSRLNKAEFSDLIEAIHAFAAEKGIALSDEIEPAFAA
jgi:hypothetical protein